MDKNWPLSFYKLNSVEREVTDPFDPNQKRNTKILEESFNGKFTLLGGTMFLISTFGIYTFFLKPKYQNSDTPQIADEQ